jgi:AraC-like DNA-binding protein
MIINKVIACNRINIKKGFRSTRKNRDHTAITIKTRGLTHYLQGEKTIVSDPAHICILPEGSDYSYVLKEEGECLMIELDVSPVPTEILCIPVSSLDEILTIFSRLEHTLNFKNEYQNVSLLADGYKLIEMLLEYSYKEYSSPRDALLIAPAISYIEENLSLSTPENAHLAALCGISTVYFRKIFTKKFGMPPVKYITHLKIQKAKGLIIGDHSSMAEVADACGFLNIQHFSRVFKAVTGLTPTEYKRKNH